MAWQLVKLIQGCPLKLAQTFALMKTRIRYFDFFAYLLGFIVRSAPDQCISCMEHFTAISPSFDSSTFALFFVQLAYAVPSFEPAFIASHSKFIEPVVRSGPITPTQAVQLFGEDVPQFATTLGDIADEVFSFRRARADSLLGGFAELSQRLAPRAPKKKLAKVIRNSARIFSKEEALRQARCEKAYRRISRSVRTGGGPWSVDGTERHWKLWQVWDSGFRRLFLKPNQRFDLHKDASFLRDESCAEAAQQKFERWLVGQEIVQESTQAFKEETQLHQIAAEFSTEAQVITITTQFCSQKGCQELCSGTFFVNKNEICFNDPSHSK
jgi:hypothetical protein